jgi:2-hydroxy-3-keto-5-methylthiopentenyl-1-phosphate phosphatase
MRTAFRRDPRSPGWSILCDFDGTVALDDVVDVLLDRFGLAGWEALEQRWREGQIGSLECMRGQVELLDMGLDELHACLDRVAIDPSFPEFVTRARALAMPIRIVSDGLDYVIRHILARHGLADLPIVANELVRSDVPRRWRLNAPFAVASCRSATCKCVQVQSPRGEPLTLSLLVGDGVSDFCVAGQADFVFAKKKLIEYCRLKGLPHQPISGFSDATKLLSTLTDLGRALPSFSALAQPLV